MAAYGGLQDQLHHQIDLDSKQIAQIILLRHESQQANRPILGSSISTRKIKVAALLGLAADVGAEDAQRLYLLLIGKLRLLMLQKRHGRTAFTPTSLPHRPFCTPALPSTPRSALSTRSLA